MIRRDLSALAASAIKYLSGTCDCKVCRAAAERERPAEVAALDRAAGRDVPPHLAAAAAVAEAERLERVKSWRPPWAVVGVDLGRRTDHSATAVVIPRHPADPVAVNWRVPGLERFPLGLPYVEQARLLNERCADLEVHTPGAVVVVVDSTGVGDGVFEIIESALSARRRVSLVPFKITGGDSWSRSPAMGRPGHEWRISKVQLVAPAMAAFEQGALRITNASGHAEQLRSELLTYRVKASSVEAGADRLEAERESDHDDLVVALCAALWFARRQTQRRGAVVHSPASWQHGFGERHRLFGPTTPR